jgi:tripartite-type tricarboxylate transporter receptor subunit TctC
MPSGRRIIAALACSVSVIAPSDATAQTFPDRPLTLIVGFAPSTGPDTVARLIAQGMSEHLKQTVVVENRTGAGGQIAARLVAKGTPDGYSLLLGEMGSISIAPAAFPNLPYDPAKELAPVSEVARADFLLVVPAQSPHKTVADFVKAAKARPERTFFATFGAGTPGHFGAELFAAQGGFKIEPIHFRTTGDALTALAAGETAGAFVTVALGTGLVTGGKVRALATTASERTKLLPEVPTFAEAGMPKVDFSGWQAVLVPAKTPQPVIDVLTRAIVAATATPLVKEKLAEAGFRAVGSSAADAQKMVASETQRWSAIVKSTGFKGN